MSGRPLLAATDRLLLPAYERPPTTGRLALVACYLAAYYCPPAIGRLLLPAFSCRPLLDAYFGSPITVRSWPTTWPPDAVHPPLPHTTARLRLHAYIWPHAPGHRLVADPGRLHGRLLLPAHSCPATTCRIILAALLLGRMHLCPRLLLAAHY